MNTIDFKKNCFPLLFFLFLGCLLITQTELSARNIEEEITQTIDDISDSCKKAVESLGHKVDAMQTYLENYRWKGIIQDRATSEFETLSHLKLNDHSRIVAVKSGEKIQGVVNCFLDPKKVSFFNIYRVVVGLKGVGPQSAIGKSLGASAGETTEHFTLVAPKTPGFYQVRFRMSDYLLESSAMEAWYDDEGQEPDASTTIGLIYVMP
jgi:hypothetical protein